MRLGVFARKLPGPALLGLALLVVTGGCSGSGRTDAQVDSTADGGRGDEGLDQEGDAADSGGPPTATCQQIRLCVAAGGGVDACLARGTPDAQALFMSLLTCLGPYCSDLVPACVCRETCQQPDGYCLDQADACLTASGGAPDAVCDQYCG
jgi:hypothetical protein